MKKLFLTLVAFVCVISMHAQEFTINAEQYVLSGYRTTYHGVSLTELCNLLETDTATFVSDFNDWQNGVISCDPIITLASDGESTNYTAGGNGYYWMTAQGQSVQWATDGSVWFTNVVADSENDAFGFWIGQFPDAVSVGDEFHCVQAVNYNGNRVEISINITIIEKPETDVVPYLSKLTVLGTVEATTTQPVRYDYTSDQVSFDLTDALAALGFDDVESLSQNLADYLFIADVDKELDCKKDELTNKWTANSGWWTGLFYDEDTDSYPGELINGESWLVYVEAFNLNADTKVLTCNVGQNPNQVSKGVNWWIPLYLIKGTNAYIIKINFKTEKGDEELPFEEKTKVASRDITINEYPNSNYKSWPMTVDISEICETLGVDNINEVKLYAESSEGVISDSRTANNGGYWLDADGYVATWGNGSVFSFEPNSDKSIIYWMQMPGMCSVGDVLHARIYYVAAQSYIQYNITINITDQESFPINEYEIVADEMYEFQIIPSSESWMDDYMDQGIDLGADHISELLGADDIKLLGETMLDNGAILITDSYTCDPAPAFWMQGNYVAACTSGNSYALIYTQSTGKFRFCQMPGAQSVGASFNSTFYLASPTTKKAIKYNIYIEYVDEIVNYTTVGSEDVVLPVWDAETEDYIETPHDMTACFEALGCDAESFDEMGQWKTVYSTGKCTTFGYQDEIYGFWFDVNGNPTETEEDMVYSAEFLNAVNSDCGEPCFRTSAFIEGTYKAKLVAEFDGKRYYFNLTLTNDADAVEKVQESKGSRVQGFKGNFNLAGQKVNENYKGIVIQNGKKVLK